MQSKFFSCVASQIQNRGEMYARFHLGSFFRGQALTLANALRRVLLAEIPSLVVDTVEIQGITHEFATISGVEESVLDILLNLKNLVFTVLNDDSSYISNEFVDTKVYLNIRGPIKVTGEALKLPPHLGCVDPSHHIATLSAKGELNICLGLKIVDLNSTLTKKKKFNELQQQNQSKIFYLEHDISPIKRVNYGVHELDTQIGSEYISVEIWTNGSLSPQQALLFGLKQLTKLSFAFII